jgi:hypothetical protein
MTTALTELEAKLAASGGAALRDELAARAQALENRLRARLAQGLARDDFPAWQAAADAAAAARQVLAGWPVGDAHPSSAAIPAGAALPSTHR